MGGRHGVPVITRVETPAWKPVVGGFRGRANVTGRAVLVLRRTAGHAIEGVPTAARHRTATVATVPGASTERVVNMVSHGSILTVFRYSEY